MWCRQDAQDAWLAAHAIHAKGFPANRDGGVLPDLPPLRPLPVSSVERSRVVCEYVLTFPDVQAAAGWLARLNRPPLKSGRRGRHHITRQNPDPIRVADLKDGAFQ